MTAKFQNPVNLVRYPWLDLLRGLAVIMVICYHNFSFLPGAQFGYLGVDIFFVLSGFLITDILCRAEGSAGMLKNFYARRILRIFPVYYAALLFVFFIYPSFVTPVYDPLYFLRHQWWFYGFMQNWLFIFTPLEKTGILNHLWSLAAEEQFYLIWPLLFLLFTQRLKLIYLLTLVIFLLPLIRSSVYHHGYREPALFTFSRFDGIIAGCATALVKNYVPHFAKRALRFSILFLALVHVAYIPFASQIPYFPCVGFTTIAVCTSWLVYAVCNLPPKYTNWTKFISYTGRLSYGLYVYHWIFFTLLSAPVRSVLIRAGVAAASSAPVIGSFLVTVLAYVFSVLSFHYFESFFTDMKKKFPLGEDTELTIFRH